MIQAEDVSCGHGGRQRRSVAEKPRIVEHSWREVSRIGPLLRDRQIPGKAIFNIDQR